MAVHASHREGHPSVLGNELVVVVVELGRLTLPPPLRLGARLRRRIHTRARACKHTHQGASRPTARANTHARARAPTREPLRGTRTRARTSPIETHSARDKSRGRRGHSHGRTRARSLSHVNALGL
eukprot:3029124-Pleurochrysis_carterae.AAC.1